MKIIAGLGNPGREYVKTKHNVGFMLADALADKLGVSEWRSDFEALVATVNVAGEKILLVKPMTYMNESGRAIASVINYYKLKPTDLIVVHDDMDIPVGKIRIRKKGSTGGHNGIKSLLQYLRDENFFRIRIGVGRPLAGCTVVNHVLSPFAETDSYKIRDTIDEVVSATICILEQGIDLAMNRYNKGKKV